MNAVPTPSIGRPGGPAAVRSLRMDDVVATYAVDGILRLRPEKFFPAIPSGHWSQLCTPNGDMLMSAGGLLIELAGSTVLIDTGVGVMKTTFMFGSVDCGSMIDVLGSLGVSPADIDVVAFTHLHFDHAGWAFLNGVKTFPNARYTLAAEEWAPHARGEHTEGSASPSNNLSHFASDQTEPVLFCDGDEIVPDMRAVVTSGHTPGHTSYVITSRAGRRLIVFGDAFHSLVQLTHPYWLSAADSDAEGVISARHRLLAQLCEPDTLGFGFHFGDQPFGRVIVAAAGELTWEPVPSSVLAPPPR
ncbi:MBL fold metallo-hydrolase [Mycobacterium sp. 21AC1]|uniref:MBL fold metallo-hydrolase n=1 Tax=[Mycobacterium] appelbergii TaxID=2939269 RepID=UPI002938E81C|nr:MBL fold metallo-hydrolase [Mycobacterium sp. 21AC1]MDV3129144.1 MBL fold metallo-hydrolase [Mycobacterium sp. 21AC1]